MPRDDERREKSVRCSFCGKTDGQVEKIIAGPGVYICNECNYGRGAGGGRQSKKEKSKGLQAADSDGDQKRS